MDGDRAARAAARRDHAPLPAPDHHVPRPGQRYRPDGALRIFSHWLLTSTTVIAVADVHRANIEEFKVCLAGRPGMRGEPLADNTQRQRLRTLRVFFERIMEWD